MQVKIGSCPDACEFSGFNLFQWDIILAQNIIVNSEKYMMDQIRRIRGGILVEPWLNRECCL